MKSLFEMNEVYAVFGYRSHQADRTHCSGLWTSALCLSLQGGHLNKGLHRDSFVFVMGIL